MSDEADRSTEQAAQSMSKKKGASTSLDSKCKDNEEQLNHPSHPDHKLTLLQHEEPRKWWEKIKYCNGCNEVMCFPGYACKSYDCDYYRMFYLHKSCAELAPNIQHPLHPHPLMLLCEPGSISDGIICDGCRNFYSEGFTYCCSWSCGFNLHPKCASKQQTFNKELTIYHFCHKHALNFCNLRESNKKDCCCCKQRISGSAYCCLECKFFIHESCKEIPKQVQHPFHPQHILLAQAMNRDIFSPKQYESCDACMKSIHGVSISCNMCKFHLHVSCANPNRRALKHNCHEHNLYYFVDDDKEGYFKCNKCHKRCTKESNYRCVQCNFNLHLECIPIPSVVTVIQKHHHPLTLVDSVKEDNPLIQYLMDSNDKVDSVKEDKENNPPIHYPLFSDDEVDSDKEDNPLIHYSMDYYCDECETSGNPKHHAYCCKKCIYIAHIECIISKDNTVNTPPAIPSNMNITHGIEQKMSDEADHITELQAAQSMSKKNGATSLDSKGKDNDEQLSHPSHPHNLTLLQLEPINGGSSEEKIKYCNGCNEVMCFPGYACHHESAKCEFYLHKSCAELAPNIQHPLHPHPLILLSEIPRSPLHYYEGIICDGCRNLYKKGFTYYCSWSCGFNLDLKCASKHDHEDLLQQQTFNKEVTQLYHFCHKHALNFCNLRKADEKYCCCCKQSISGSAYCCLECRFFIHESCTEIPKQVQHPFHPQHLLLAQPIEGMDLHTTEFLRKISYHDPSRYCNVCLLKIHGIKIGCIKCSFNLHVSCANRNYRALKHKCHEHNMYYFVDDDTMWYSECNKCHERCDEESFYRCVECKFNLHLECIPIPSVVTVTQKHHHHPLTLINSIKEDNPLIQYLMDSNDKVDHFMDYYCDVCETPGNPKHHAYCCKECIYIAHVECIISEDLTDFWR
ncbi:hypothetical protein LWI29_011640 [Acer saccharum]|uniref:Zinc finger PHD-type domain-containing protein n=1 Tax=Acer saccharum TaxID=4024 RepID=A0AA39T4B4_ACESA|nr:hypothetical protein LWI29_011640 [Acer saccharum]